MFYLLLLKSGENSSNTLQGTVRLMLTMFRTHGTHGRTNSTKTSKLLTTTHYTFNILQQ